MSKVGVMEITPRDRLMTADSCQRWNFSVISWRFLPCPRSSKYSNQLKKMLPPLENLDDCKGVRYRVQVNCYKYACHAQRVAETRHMLAVGLSDLALFRHGRSRPRIHHKDLCSVSERDTTFELTQSRLNSLLGLDCLLSSYATRTTSLAHSQVSRYFAGRLT